MQRLRESHAFDNSTFSDRQGRQGGEKMTEEHEPKKSDWEHERDCALATMIRSEIAYKQASALHHQAEKELENFKDEVDKIIEGVDKL